MASSININQNNNDITLQDNNRSISITDNNAGTTVNVTQPVTSVVTVAAIGPQGPVGPIGPIPTSGSFTGSFSGSFIGNLTGTASNATSASYALTASYLEGYISPFPYSGSAVITGSLTVSGSSTFTNIGPAIFSGSVNGIGGFSGSFSGSFQGDGAGLTNIPASGITGLNLSQIAVGSVSASVSTGTGSFTVTSGSSTFMFVSSSGNVGIGTTTPSAPLHVVGSATSGFDAIRFKGQYSETGYLSTSNGAIYLATGPSVAGSYVELSNATINLNAGTTQIRFTIGSERMRIGNNGNVLINTTTDAGYKLDVNGTTRIISNTLIGTSAYSDTNSGLVIGRIGSAGASRGILASNTDYQDFGFVKTDISSGNINSWTFGQRYDTYFGNTVGSFQIAGGYLSNSGASSMVGGGYRVPLIANPNGDVIIAGASANAINGNVGISRISPAYKLDVSGSTNITGNLTVTGSATLTGALTASNAVISGNVTVLGTASINTLIVNQTQLSTGSNQLGDAADDFQTLYGTVRIPTGSLTVTGSITQNASTASFGGIVGIGTTTPGTTLDINGGLRVQGFQAAPTGTGLEFGYYAAGLYGYFFTYNRTTSTYLDTALGVQPSQLYLKSTGNVLIGTTTDAGFKLDVNGTARIKGTGTTSSTTSFTVQNNAGSTNLQILDNGAVQVINEGNFSVARYGNNLLSTGQAVSRIATYNNYIQLEGTYTQIVNGSNIWSFRQNSYTETYAPLITFSTFKTIDTSAQMEVSSTTKGFLPPRTNLTSNISSPAQGLMTYVTASATEGLYYYNSGSAIGWHKVLTNSGSQEISGSLNLSGFATGSVLFTSGSAGVVTGSSNLFWDNTNARLGIGGTPSAFKLDIVGTSSANIIGVKVRNTSTNGYTEINCYNNTGGDNDRVYFGVGGTATGDVYQNRGYFISSLALEGITFTAGKTTTGDMRFFTGGNNERLRIFGNGNIGINTTTDAGFKLDVNGTARIQTSLVLNGSSALLSSTLTAYQNGANRVFSLASSTSKTDATTRILFSLNSSESINQQALDFQFNGASSIGNRYYSLQTSESGVAYGGGFVMQKDGGWVGIGTSTDSGYKFDVNGTARVKGAGSTNATVAFTVINSSGSELLTINDSNIATFAGGNGRIVTNVLRCNYFNSANDSFTIFQTNGATGNAKFYQGVSIGTSSDPSTSAQLEIVSTTKGLLPPRTNLTSNISTPAQGLITYVTASTTEGLYYYNSGSAIGWHKVLSTTGSQSISGSLTVVGTSNLGGATFSNGGATFSNNVNVAALNEGSGNSWVNLNTTRVHLGQNNSTGGLNVTAATQFVGVGKLASSPLDILGNTFLTGSLSITSSAGTGSAIYAYKSGSTVLDIQGSQGQLFSVIDTLSGSLMSVNDVSGLPILEVFSDDRVVMGTYGAPALTVSGSALTVATSSVAPSGTAPEGTFRFATVGGAYYIYAYLGGAWRSGSLF